MSQISQRFLTALREQVAHTAGLIKAGIASGAYIYPVRGITYTASHPQLFGPLYSRLPTLLALSVSIIAAMFTFTYVPQAFLLQFVAGPWAWISTIALVLSESSVLISLGWSLIDGGKVQREVFDNTLNSLGEKGRVERRGVVPGSKVQEESKKGFIDNLVNSVLLLPLNFIPIVGTFVFLGAQGKRAGPGYHSRYFEQKGLKKSDRDGWVKQREPAYFAFGLAARLLEMLPVVGVAFAATNTVGAALWASKLEGEERKAL